MDFSNSSNRTNNRVYPMEIVLSVGRFLNFVFQRFFLIVFVFISVVTAVQSENITLEEAPVTYQYHDALIDQCVDFYHVYIVDHLQVGIQMSYFNLTDDTKRTYDENGDFKEGFLGSIDRMDEKQDFFPTLYVRYFFMRYIGVELGWEKMAAETRKFNSDSSDGNIIASGPALWLIGRYPNTSVFTPYAGFGIVFLNARFCNDDLWHNGFSDNNQYNEWREQGSPPWPNDGYQRTIDLENKNAPILSAGCTIEMLYNISADIAFHYMPVNVNAHYYLSRYGEVFDDRGDHQFPLDNWSLQLGVIYAF